VRRAVSAGVKLVISSDAHSVRELRYTNDFGLGVARRGWASAHDVLNTRPLDGLLAGLKHAGRHPQD
jgi:DNA polymerase (family 10)